jgi:hypothetical protein
LVPSFTDGAGKAPDVTPDETGARSVVILASAGEGAWAKLGATAMDAGPITAKAAIIVRRFIARLLSEDGRVARLLSRLFAFVTVTSVRGRILHNFPDVKRLRPDCGPAPTYDNLITI